MKTNVKSLKEKRPKTITVTVWEVKPDPPNIITVKVGVIRTKRPKMLHVNVW